MSYLFKKTEDQEKIVFEVRTKNYLIFIALVFLSIIPAADIATQYWQYNINLFRVIYVGLILAFYALLGGEGLFKILFHKAKIREGSILSFKNPAKFIIKK